MMRIHSAFAIAAMSAGLLFGGPASASAIISGAGDSWTGGAAIGGGSGGAVAITPHSAWQTNNPGGSGAVWISYANTGVGGSILAPQAGSAANPLGTAVIMTVTETFTAGIGAILAMQVWADDTARVLIDGIELIAGNFSQGTCAAGSIGCEPNEFGLINYTFTTDGTHTLAFEVFQVGNGTNPSDNPFGLLYAGTLTAAVPEPGTLALFGAGLAGLGWLRRRRHCA
jgi:hypothetical protein